jgi:hypothetical protein
LGHFGFATQVGGKDTGDDCISIGQRCLADCRDTLYPFTLRVYNRDAACSYLEEHWCEQHQSSHHSCTEGRYSAKEPLCKSNQRGFLTNNATDTMIVVGVNHKAANMSAYSSLAIYDMEYLWGVTGVGDDTLQDTADRYVSASDLAVSPLLEAALPYLYAYQVKRECPAAEEGVGCITIPSSATPDNYQLFIPISHTIGFAERMYDNPISHVGPSPEEIVMPIHLHIISKGTSSELEN